MINSASGGVVPEDLVVGLARQGEGGAQFVRCFAFDGVGVGLVGLRIAKIESLVAGHFGRVGECRGELFLERSFLIWIDDQRLDFAGDGLQILQTLFIESSQTPLLW